MASSAADPPPNVNKGPQILIACGICVGVALAMVVLRLVVRWKVLRNMGWDDYCILAAMVVMFTEMMVIIPQVMLGAGRHVQYIDPDDFVTGLHLNFVTQPLCLIALCLTKLSVGLFLLRLTTTTWHIRLIWGIMAFTVLSWAGNFLTVFFQCRPLRLTWDASASGRCIEPNNLKFAAFFNSSVSALTDLLFALLPVPLMWGVQMNKRTKVAIAAILSLGVFATVAAVIKMLYLGRYGKYGDFLYDSAELTIWTTVEICTAIVAACAPCLKPLVRSVLNTTSHNRSKRGYVHYEEQHYARQSRSGAPRQWDASRAGTKSSGVQLGSLSHVYGGNGGRSESQEMFGRPNEQDPYIAKTVSVSVQ